MFPPQSYCFPGGSCLCEIWTRLVFQDTNPLCPLVATLSGECVFVCVGIFVLLKDMFHFN